MTYTPHFCGVFLFLMLARRNMKRIGVIGIVLKKDRETAMAIQNLLSTFSDIVIGRMGVPDKETGISTISVIVKGTNEQISALSGKLGKLNEVYVKSAVTSFEVE